MAFPTPLYRILYRILFSAWVCLSLTAAAAEPAPILIGISAEYGLKDSQAAQSIEKGVRLAVEEINRVGLLGGRQIQVFTRDDRGLPARALDNLRELAVDPDVTAVFCGRFSPVALELARVANQEKMILLDPWAAADGITRQPGNPNFVFRLSLTDTWAMQTMLRHALNRKLDRLAVMLPNTAWGRSSQAALAAFVKSNPRLKVAEYWYNWGDTDFSDKLLRAQAEGMKGLLMVANEAEGVHIVRQMAALPAAKRVPILSHWGVAAGNFVGLLGPALNEVDLSVVQTFSFTHAQGDRADQVRKAYRRTYSAAVEELPALAGFAHAYDLTHMLALAITRAGSSSRVEVREALERLPEYRGLVKSYRRPFGPNDHEALESSQLFMARFIPSGALVPVK